MSTRVYSNNAVGTVLTSGVDSSASTLEVQDTTGWPTPGSGEVGVVAIDHGSPATVEIATYTGKTSTTLTGVARGIDGTTARAHAEGVQVRHAVSAKDIEDPQVGAALTQEIEDSIDNQVGRWQEIDRDVRLSNGQLLLTVPVDLRGKFSAYELIVGDYTRTSGSSTAHLVMRINDDDGANYRWAMTWRGDAAGAGGNSGAAGVIARLGTLSSNTARIHLAPSRVFGGPEIVSWSGSWYRNANPAEPGTVGGRWNPSTSEIETIRLGWSEADDTLFGLSTGAWAILTGLRSA